MTLTKRTLGRTGLEVTDLAYGAMDTTIVGTLHPEHLTENVRVAEQGPLPADVYAEAKRRLTAAAAQ